MGAPRTSTLRRDNIVSNTSESQKDDVRSTTPPTTWLQRLPASTEVVSVQQGPASAVPQTTRKLSAQGQQLQIPETPNQPPLAPLQNGTAVEVPQEGKEAAATFLRPNEGVAATETPKVDSAKVPGNDVISSLKERARNTLKARALDGSLYGVLAQVSQEKSRAQSS